MSEMTFGHECAVDGCGKRIHAKGWCKSHYLRWRRLGNPTAGGPLVRRDLSPEDRFWLKVNKTNGCWLWTGCTTPFGYGQLRVAGKAHYAHRFSYELVHGPIATDLDHRHTCPKNCVRPDHLRPATAKQNGENRSGANKNSASGVRGVFWHAALGKWVATVTHRRHRFHVGVFSHLADAEAAVTVKRRELFTHSDMDKKVTL